MLNFKTPRLSEEWKSGCLFPDLKFIVFAMAAYAEFEFDKGLLATSFYRTEKEEQKVGAKSRTHKGWRACDLSAKSWTKEQLESLKDFVHNRFECIQAIVVVHKVKNGRLHIHVQVPRYRKGTKFAWRI